MKNNKDKFILFCIRKKALKAAIILTVGLLIGVFSIFFHPDFYRGGGLTTIILAAFAFMGPLLIAVAVSLFVGYIVYLIYRFLFKKITKTAFIISLVILFPIFVYLGSLLNISSWDFVMGRIFPGHIYKTDTNNDGKIDKWVYVDWRTNVTKVAKDTNYDGKEDFWEYYDKGKVVRRETDINYDGKVDKVEQVEK